MLRSLATTAIGNFRTVLSFSLSQVVLFPPPPITACPAEQRFWQSLWLFKHIFSLIAHAWSPPSKALRAGLQSLFLKCWHVWLGLRENNSISYLFYTFQNEKTNFIQSPTVDGLWLRAVFPRLWVTLHHWDNCLGHFQVWPRDEVNDSIGGAYFSGGGDWAGFWQACSPLCESPQWS